MVSPFELTKGLFGIRRRPPGSQGRGGEPGRAGRRRQCARRSWSSSRSWVPWSWWPSSGRGSDASTAPAGAAFGTPIGLGGAAAMPTIGRFGAWPRPPRSGALPKARSSPVALACQYPAPSGLGTMADTVRSALGPGPEELGVAESEDTAVGGREPVALPRRRGRHGGDGPGQPDVAGGAEELRRRRRRRSRRRRPRTSSPRPTGSGPCRRSAGSVSWRRWSRRTRRRRRRRSRRRRRRASSRCRTAWRPCRRSVC